MKIISIHQPHYLLWTPLLFKIYKSNIHVFLDDVQYSKNDWQNRNYIYGNQNAIMLSVPVERKSKTINSKFIIKSNWKKKHMKSIYYNLRENKYFDDIFSIYTKCLNEEHITLSELNISLILNFCEYLNISHVKFIKSSDLDLVNRNKTQKLVDVCKILDGKAYLTSSFGLEQYVDETLFMKNNIKIQTYKIKESFDNCDLSLLNCLSSYGKDSMEIIGEQCVII